MRASMSRLASVARNSRALNPTRLRLPSDHAEEQLAQHGGLAESHRQLAAEFGGEQYDDERQGHRGDGVVMRRAGSRGEREQRVHQPSLAGAARPNDGGETESGPNNAGHPP